MGLGKTNVIDARISDTLERIMENRSAYVAETSSDGIGLPIEGLDRDACIAVPILGNGDVTGCVVVLYNDKRQKPTLAEAKLAEVAAQFLGKQTEE